MNIVGLISQDVMIVKRGKDYFGLCPFHPEKTPSFSVSEAAQLFYCFGCGAGGDAISWLRTYRKLSFREAARLVGKEVDAPRHPPSRRVAHAEAEIALAYYQWEHAERRRWVDAFRALLDDKEEAAIGYRETVRCPELYTAAECDTWERRLEQTIAALEEGALVPTMADVFTYDSHREERVQLWLEARQRGA